MGVSLQRINEIVDGLRSLKPLEARRITMDEARANNLSLRRNGLGKKYPTWFLLPGTPCYIVRQSKKRHQLRRPRR